jgi:multiple sugar transport system substrate-binding protein
MSLFTFNNQYNAPGRSRHSGKIKAANIPMAAEAKSSAKVVAPRNEVWCYVIPKNAPDKERTWAFIRHVTTKDNTVRWALDVPASPRLSTYKQREIRERVHFADDLARVMPSSILMTNWENYSRAEDLFKDAVESVLLGRAAPKAAMDEVAKRLVTLLPKGRE